MNTCDSCKWWYNLEDGTRTIMGECLRFPPLPLIGISGIASRFPETTGSDYCGEHTPKETNNAQPSRKTITQTAETTEEGQEG